MKKEKMTVGFAELTSYGKIVKELGSEKSIDILREAFKVMGDSIINNGGKIHKYIGDSILFTFIDAKKAIKASKEIVGSYSKKIGSSVIKPYVSLATGEVVVCNIGHPSNMVEDIVGETVNKAAILSREAGRNESKLAFCDETKKYE